MMKRFCLAAMVAVAAIAGIGHDAVANGPAQFGFGFQPFGFYQPYGVQYSTRTPTPPYFALNPPVYYGARYARPYGISPFAAYPEVGVPAGYHARLRSDFYEGEIRQNSFMHAAPPCGTCGAANANSAAELHMTASDTVRGGVRINPFATTDRQLAIAD